MDKKLIQVSERGEISAMILLGFSKPCSLIGHDFLLNEIAIYVTKFKVVDIV